MKPIQDQELLRLALGVVRGRTAAGGPEERVAAALGADDSRWLRRRSRVARRRRAALAALLLAFAVAVPTAARLAAPHGVITATGDAHEAYLSVCYVLENQNPSVA